MAKLIFLLVTLSAANFINAGFFVDEYYFSSPSTVDWFEASRYCTYHGMYLIDIPHFDEYRRIVDRIKQVKRNTTIGSVWTSGNRLWQKGCDYWETTGQEMLFSDFPPGEPTRGGEQCILLWDGADYKFGDNLCTNKHAFMCRKFKISPYMAQTDEIEVTRVCASKMTKLVIILAIIIGGWNFINAGLFIDEYYFSTPTKLDWFEASRYCTYHHMYLIDVPNEFEYRRVIDKIKHVIQNTTIGSVWTSGNRLWNRNQDYWETTGREMVFSDFARGEPTRGAEQCILLWDGADYKFGDNLCTNKHAFVCRKFIQYSYDINVRSAK